MNKNVYSTGNPRMSSILSPYSGVMRVQADAKAAIMLPQFLGRRSWHFRGRRLEHHALCPATTPWAISASPATSAVARICRTCRREGSYWAIRPIVSPYGIFDVCGTYLRIRNRRRNVLTSWNFWRGDWRFSRCFSRCRWHSCKTGSVRVYLSMPWTGSFYDFV